MTKAETAKLLALVAAYDQRTVGRSDVDAWYEVAKAGRWEPAHAARAVIEHYATSTDRLMPAHITRRIRDLRERYARTYTHQPYPAGLTDVDAQIAWEQAEINQHISDHMNRWAEGDTP